MVIQYLDGYANDPNRGLYLALDPEGKIIRFIPLGGGLLRSYDHDEPYPWFEMSNKIWQLTLELQSRLGNNLKEILSKVDYNRIRRLHILYREIAHAFHLNRNLEYYQLLPHILCVRNAYDDLLDELKKNGMAELIMREIEFIRSLLSEDTIPQFGLYQINWPELIKAIRSVHESDYIGKTKMGENLLSILSEERLVQVIMDEKTKEELSQEQEDPIRMCWRLNSVTEKIAAGGVLTTGNLSLGVIAGVFNNDPTIGPPAIGVASGILLSCYVGLNMTCKSLTHLAAVIESN